MVGFGSIWSTKHNPLSIDLFKNYVIKPKKKLAIIHHFKGIGLEITFTIS
jgi:hypothetical protein